MNRNDDIAEAIAYVDDGRYGNAIKAIARLTQNGNHRGAIAAARHLCQRRGNATDWGVLIQTCRRSSHEVRSEVGPSVIESVEHWIASEKYEYRTQTVASLLTLLRVLDDRKRFWHVYNTLVQEPDKQGNEFILPEYAQMLRQDDKNSYVGEWIPRYQALPKELQANDLLTKLFAQALLDQGTTPLEDVRAILQECRDEQFKVELLQRIDVLSQRRGKEPSSDVQETPAAGELALPPTGKPSVFIVHGRDPGSRSELENVLFRIGAEPWTFGSLPKEGSVTVIEVLEKYVPTADAIVTLMTPDDEARKRGTNDPLEPRGRENVMIEAGFAMISRRTRSLLVALGGVHIPTDFEGIHRIQAAHWNSEVALRVAQRLRDMGLAVDPSKAI